MGMKVHFVDWGYETMKRLKQTQSNKHKQISVRAQKGSHCKKA